MGWQPKAPSDCAALLTLVGLFTGDKFFDAPECFVIVNSMAAEIPMHQTRDLRFVSRLALEIDALDQGRRTIADADGRNSDFTAHGRRAFLSSRGIRRGSAELACQLTRKDCNKLHLPLKRGIPAQRVVNFPPAQSIVCPMGPTLYATMFQRKQRQALWLVVGFFCLLVARIAVDFVPLEVDVGRKGSISPDIGSKCRGVVLRYCLCRHDDKGRPTLFA